MATTRPAGRRMGRAEPSTAAAKELRRALGLDQPTFARLAGATTRSVANWEAGSTPRGIAQQRLNELRRMRTMLSGVVAPKAIGKWFQTPNEAFGGLKPVEVIERGESDRIWKMIYDLHAGSLS